MDYDKNSKPLVKVQKEKPFNSATFRQGDKSKAPLTRTTSNAPLSEKVMPKNKVSAKSSAKLQKATRLPGRVSLKDDSFELC